ncbi:hypothetical protein HOB30_02475 [Candidatus Falkowbacteria bacterium]|jgi:hypothetical protein|nr:hypothetical protein [Candidatus Falkowbacteria bacterium]
MKKYQSGFVPVNYNIVGKNLIKIGLVGLLFKLLSIFTGWYEASNFIVYGSIGLLLVGSYLVFIVSKNK